MQHNLSKMPVRHAIRTNIKWRIVYSDISTRLQWVRYNTDTENVYHGIANALDLARINPLNSA